MSTAIIVDSACELPNQLTRSRSVKTLPLNIEIGNEAFRDQYQGDQVLEFISNGQLNPKLNASSDAASQSQVVEFLQKEIIPKFKYAIVFTVSSTRSDQFDVWQAVNRNLPSILRGMNAQHNFSMNIIDTGTAYSGQTLVALECIRLAKQRTSRRELIHDIKMLLPHLQAYSAPADIGYLRRRAVQRGDNTMSLVNTIIGKALKISPVLFGMNNEIGLSTREKGHQKAIDRIIDHAIDAIKIGLKSPVIAVSYAGSLSELEKMPKYTQLRSLAKKYRYSIFPTVSCLSNTINLGPGNFGLALAPKHADFVIAER